MIFTKSLHVVLDNIPRATFGPIPLILINALNKDLSCLAEKPNKANVSSLTMV